MLAGVHIDRHNLAVRRLEHRKTLWATKISTIRDSPLSDCRTRGHDVIR